MSEQQEGPPKDRAAILEQAGPRARTVFETVRDIVDGLEEAAPWNSLYSPPETAKAFLGMEKALLNVIKGIPDQVQKMFDKLEGQRQSGDMGAGELASFFDNTFLIISRDRDLLVKALTDPANKLWDNKQTSLVCELSADLKGKYQSALMGVAGKVIAKGRWSGVEIEPVLFPEKKDEFDRNHSLVESLKKVTLIIRELTRDMPFAELIDAWSAGRKIDQYALVDLTILVGAVGQLLKEKARRALYSGDYHHIRDQERGLNERISKLQIMHASTWSENTVISLAGVYPRLVELIVEIAAILDRALLQRLIGEQRFNELGAAAGKTEPSSTAPASPHLETLSHLLKQDDLGVFLEALLGNVRKRESLVVSKGRPQRNDDETSPDPMHKAKLVFESLYSAEKPPYRAFVAALADQKTISALAMEFNRDLSQQLVPLLLEIDSLSQFGKIIQSTCAGISSSSDRQPMETTLRLLDRLREVFADESG